jgi:DNA-binding LacI/PurR family transcriptional regulator
MRPPATGAARRDYKLDLFAPTLIDPKIGRPIEWDWRRLLNALEKRLELSNGSISTKHFDKLDGLIRYCFKRKCHGLVISQPLPGSWLIRLRDLWPTVIVGYDSHPGVDSVGPNEMRGATTILEYLLNLRHNQIAWVGVLDHHAPFQIIDDPVGTKPSDWQVMQTHVSRFSAWHAITNYKPYRNNMTKILIDRDWQKESIEDVTNRVVSRILRFKKKPTAIVAASYPLALELTHSLKRHKIDVPGQVNILSYGGRPPGENQEIKITVLDMPIKLMGQMIPELVERRLANPDAPPVTTQFDCTITEGTTTSVST